ncbi:unnamed protein product [Allacma fusca]|uniref:Uncharacterized protein n=1 Tax=Allacma fusca TaxID=39272 RepID=A0A8J2P9S7_9HEXA|nr:unnamed protein product [Allacma fusca]
MIDDSLDLTEYEASVKMPICAICLLLILDDEYSKGIAVLDRCRHIAHQRCVNLMTCVIISCEEKENPGRCQIPKCKEIFEVEKTRAIRIATDDMASVIARYVNYNRNLKLQLNELEQTVEDLQQTINTQSNDLDQRDFRIRNMEEDLEGFRKLLFDKEMKRVYEEMKKEDGVKLGDELKFEEDQFGHNPHLRDVMKTEIMTITLENPQPSASGLNNVTQSTSERLHQPMLHPNNVITIENDIEPISIEPYQHWKNLKNNNNFYYVTFKDPIEIRPMVMHNRKTYDIPIEYNINELRRECFKKGFYFNSDVTTRYSERFTDKIQTDFITQYTYKHPRGYNVKCYFMGNYMMVGDGALCAMAWEGLYENKPLRTTMMNSLLLTGTLSPKKLKNHLIHAIRQLPPMLAVSIGNHDVRKEIYRNVIKNTKQLLHLMISKGAKRILLIPMIYSYAAMEKYALKAEQFNKWLKEEAVKIKGADLIYMEQFEELYQKHPIPYFIDRQENIFPTYTANYEMVSLIATDIHDESELFLTQVPEQPDTITEERYREYEERIGIETLRNAN